jgi:predicted kinase
MEHHVSRHTLQQPRPAAPRFRRRTHRAARAIDPARPTVNVLLGVPGAGKTTFAAAAGQLGVRVSLDDARALLGTGPEDQRVTDHAVQHVLAEADRLLDQHQTVLVDATSTTAAERQTWLQLAQAHRVAAVAYWLTTPLQIALQRNGIRDRHVPGTVIAEMSHNLAEVTVGGLYAEGFALVHEIHTGTGVTR